MRKGARGSEKRAQARGGNDCRDVRNDTVNTNTVRGVDWPAVAVTETKRKRLLKKRTREAGSKGGKAATELEDADTDD